MFELAVGSRGYILISWGFSASSIINQGSLVKPAALISTRQAGWWGIVMIHIKCRSLTGLTDRCSAIGTVSHVCSIRKPVISWGVNAKQTIDMWLWILLLVAQPSVLSNVSKPVILVFTFLLNYLLLWCFVKGFNIFIKIHIFHFIITTITIFFFF